MQIKNSISYAILSDIHGNTPALEAVLEDIDRVGCEKIFVLGDIINGVDPHGSLELVRSLGDRAVSIKGNAEYYTLTPDLDELPDRETPENSSLIVLINYFRDRLSTDELTWLAGLPDILFWEGACLVHDSPIDRLFPDTWHAPGLAEKYQEWNYHAAGISAELPDTRWQVLWDWMKANQAWGVFCGHTHSPFIRYQNGFMACNVGAAGFALDADPRPSWALVEMGSDRKPAITIRRVSYAIDRIIQMVDDSPEFHFTDGEKQRSAYKKMLLTGIHWRFHLDN